MNYIRKFNESKSSSFLEKRDKIIDMVKSLMNEYDEFTKIVSPNDWRITGHNITELRKILKDLNNLTEITEKDKEIDWVKKELKKNYKQRNLFD